MSRQPNPEKVKAAYQSAEKQYHREQWERTLREGTESTFEWLTTYYAQQMADAAAEYASKSANFTDRMAEIRAAQKAYRERTQHHESKGTP